MMTWVTDVDAVIISVHQNKSSTRSPPVPILSEFNGTERLLHTLLNQGRPAITESSDKNVLMFDSMKSCQCSL